jgi:hypothetical protein
MPAKGWKQLLAGEPWFRAEGAFPMEAYSEFVPPPYLGPRPYGTAGINPMPERDPYGWNVSEYEEAFELRPGLETLAHHAVTLFAHLGCGDRAHCIARHKLQVNPYWPPELADMAGQLKHERYVVLLALALSRTQDDKGRLRWTLFGGSEQGPAAAFAKSFLTTPTREVPDRVGVDFVRNLLAAAYGEEVRDAQHLYDVGFRVLGREERDAMLWPADIFFPAWTTRYQWGSTRSTRGVKYLLTFRPFAKLPPAVRRAYLAGELHLLPFPGSLLFWGAPPYRRLQEQLPFAMQIPLLHLFHRHEDPHGLRVPQSGWLHEPRPGKAGPSEDHGPVRNTYKRSHRWQRIHRHEDEMAVLEHEDRLAHVLFSTEGRDLGLYGKPMARNAQLWTHDYKLLLDGPRASTGKICAASEAVAEGGQFGYRFLFPAMRVGRHEVYWHRPLVAYLSPETQQPAVLPAAPCGYLTAYDTAEPELANPVELWPRMLQRDGHADAVTLFDRAHDERPHQTARNVHKLLDARDLLDRSLPPAFARRLLTVPRQETLEEWLASLPGKSADAERTARLVERLRATLAADDGKPAAPLTFARTANRPFEVKYWQTIYDLASGQYKTKNNADCVQDEPTKRVLPHHRRDLDDLGDFLLGYYEELIGKYNLGGRALAGELPFRWHTPYPFHWMGGWAKNQEGEAQERDIVVVIPGRDRKRAVIMGDHYDTAYMVDCYDPEYGGNGARLAAEGADDNHSATAALMLGAPIFLEMSRAGKLRCDIWLIHLTGEEFPADCLGARALSQRLVEGRLQLRLPDRNWRDLSRTRVMGVYVADMIAHNNCHDRDVFQMAPGVGPESLWLAYQAHRAAEAWNAGTKAWNKRPSRKGCGRGQRSADGKTPPPPALHPELDGQVRLPYDPRSTLYNTDGQVFSDAGVPVVLFMENYDINRSGYHDTHDTMENIDLDYGAAVAAILIESVARAATEKSPFV